jgi:hypothetical protein
MRRAKPVLAVSDMQPEKPVFYGSAGVHITHTSPRKPARRGQAQGAIVSEMPRKQEVVYAVTLAQQGFALVDRLDPYRFRTF